MAFGTIKAPLPCRGKRNALSICMIVKNEEANIGRAIQSFLPFADEIIVNDTGSTDRTIEIVKSFPKTTLITSEWVNDFAYSRNLSVEKATCSWILWMDADDYVPPDQTEFFNKLKTAPLDKLISFTVCNTEDGKPKGLRFMQARMFPNNPDLRFEGRIHESVINSSEVLGLHPVNTSILIWHMGYETAEIREKKAKRNLELQLADPEHDKRIEGLLEFGDTYSILNETERATEYYRRAVEFKNCPRDRIDLKMSAYTKLGRHLLLANKLDESEKIYLKCLEHFPKNEEAVYGLGIILLLKENKEESMKYFRKLLTMNVVVPIGGTNFYAIKADALKNLSIFEFEKGNFKLSRNHAEQLLKHDPGNKEAEWLFERANAALINSKDKRALLSLCMIVKNEEKNLEECLKSVQGLADEIIITDTGSNDKTLDIAKSFNAKIEHFTWINNFAAARNYSVSKATSRWIIWLDADDRVPKQTVSELRRILQSEMPNKVFSLVVCNSTDEGKTGTRFSQIRVFPNNKAQIKFEGRIHEQIIPSIRKLGFQEIKLPLEVFHTGYENPAVLREKQLRNLELFREEFPGDKGMNALDMFHYGACYEILGDYENALKWLRESLSEAKKQHYDELLILLPHDIARILELQGNLQGALESLDLSLAENPQYEPSMSRKARILNALGQQEEAVKWFGYCASFVPKIDFLPSDTTAAHTNSLKFLAEYWNGLGQAQLGVEILKMLKNMLLGTPHNPLALAEIYIAQDKAKEAMDNLMFLKKEFIENPDFTFLYIQSMALTGDVQSAITTVAKAKKKFPQHADIASLAQAMGVA